MKQEPTNSSALYIIHSSAEQAKGAIAIPIKTKSHTENISRHLGQNSFRFYKFFFWTEESLGLFFKLQIPLQKLKTNS
jgi:hypothetical protein